MNLSQGSLRYKNRTRQQHDGIMEDDYNLSNLKEEEDQEDYFAGGEVVFVGHPHIENTANEVLTIEESEK